VGCFLKKCLFLSINSFKTLKKLRIMGITYVNIRIQNGDDIAYARRQKIGIDEIRELTVSAMVDTGSIMLCINEDIREALDLQIVGDRPSQLANGQRLRLPVTSSVVVWYEDRWCSTSALVLPGDAEPLLGAIPLEEMDLYVHPGRQELAPLHPDGPVMILK
jgi:clan AA aspartic protease